MIVFSSGGARGRCIMDAAPRSCGSRLIVTFECVAGLERLLRGITIAEEGGGGVGAACVLFLESAERSCFSGNFVRIFGEEMWECGIYIKGSRFFYFYRI